jgi:hypothetical protein
MTPQEVSQLCALLTRSGFLIPRRLSRRLPRQTLFSPPASSSANALHVLRQHSTCSSTSTPAQSDGARKPQAQRGCPGGGRRPEQSPHAAKLPERRQGAHGVSCVRQRSGLEPGRKGPLVLQGDQHPHREGQIPSPKPRPTTRAETEVGSSPVHALITLCGARSQTTPTAARARRAV